MQEIRSFRSPDGTCVVVGHCRAEADIEALVSAGEIDCLIVASEDGFTPFGAYRRLFASEIGVNEAALGRLAESNQKSERVALIALPSHRKESRLRGLIISPSETSECYKQFAVPRFGAPYRDFFYNVTYEALSYATQRWGARRLGTFHLSAGNNFHSDIALCQAEAVAHFTGRKSRDVKLDSFCFVGCCITSDHLSELRNEDPAHFTGNHRPIQTRISSKDGYDLVDICWARSRTAGL